MAIPIMLQLQIVIDIKTSEERGKKISGINEIKKKKL